MTESSTAPATGGMTVDQAAKAFEAMMGADKATPEAETGTEEVQAEAEDEDEQPSEPEAEAESDDDEDQSQVAAQPTDDTPVRITVDGQEVEVTLHELKRGFLRESDYTRKTQALAEKQASLEADLAPLRAQYKTVVEAFEQQLAAPPHTDEALEHWRANDPASYAVAVADNQRHRDNLDKVRAEKTRLAQEEQQQTASNRAKAFSEAETELRSAVPDWQDPQKFSAGLKGCFDYAANYGLTPDDILSNGDAKRLSITLQILRDAAVGRAIQSKKPVAQQAVAAVKTARPGTQQAPASKTTDLSRARSRLAQTGRVNDAAAVFLKMLPD